VQRRDVLTLLGGVAAPALPWPRAARAQPDERMRRVGVLTSNPSNDPNGPANVFTFRKALEDHGWIAGRHVRIDDPPGGADRLQSRLREILAAAPTSS
jgi:hypothetical protein